MKPNVLYGMKQIFFDPCFFGLKERAKISATSIVYEGEVSQRGGKGIIGRKCWVNGTNSKMITVKHLFNWRLEILLCRAL